MSDELRIYRVIVEIPKERDALSAHLLCIHPINL